MRRQVHLLLLLLIVPFGLMACTLFGGAGDDDEESAAIVTATPGPETAVAEADTEATTTPTPTPTLDPLFPTPVLVETWIAEQEFENGWAFALQDRAEIWVAAFDNERGGAWTIYEDEFFLEEESTGQELIPEFDEVPPEGMVMPVRGFGWLWANNPEVREALGWGVWIELGQNTTLRYDAGGLVNANGDYVSRPGRFTITNLSGDVFTFDEGTQSFTWVPAS